MQIIEEILLVLTLLSVAGTVSGWLCGGLISHYLLIYRPRKRWRSSINYRPFVSVLKPVKGLDEGAFENFTSFCDQDYPHYELIFGVEDENDPVIDIIQRLRETFKHIDIKLVISKHRIGNNPKVNNLENACRESRGEVLIISDSDIRVGKSYISEMVEPLSDNTIGAATSVVMINGAKNIWCTLLALLFNGGISTIFTFLYHLGLLNMVYGPSVSFRREVLDEIGGFEPLSDVVAEDINTGNLIHQKGYKIVMPAHSVKNIKRWATLWHESMHIYRWLVVLKKHAAPYLLMMPVTLFAFPFSLLYCLLTRTAFSWSLLIFVVLFFLIYMIIMSVKFAREPRLCRYIFAFPIAHFIFVAVWIAALAGSHVVWRGVRYKIGPGGRIVKKIW